jgi:ribonucleoside-diphosphate reductase alpha chain
MRDWNDLSEISKILYEQTYLLPNETYEQWVERVCRSYQNDKSHGNRLIKYLKSHYWHPSTPISSNGGTDRGLPISCYIKEVQDSKEDIFNSWLESSWLGALGGGVGVYYGNLREINHTVSTVGKSSGIIPFIKVDEALTNAISQGGIRRYNECVTLDIYHPEIEEFIDIRKSTGDNKRRSPDIHHAVNITDGFMLAVINNRKFNLISPKNSEICKEVNARDLWTKILKTRIETGEPFITFIDTANNGLPKEIKDLRYKIKASQLCQEIMLPTNESMSNVCCLASINLEYWIEYESNIDQMLADISDFLDNVLTDFLNKTKDKIGFEKVRKGVLEFRAIGIGVMGYHSYLQSESIAFECLEAKIVNKRIF